MAIAGESSYWWEHVEFLKVFLQRIYNTTQCIHECDFGTLIMFNDIEFVYEIS